MRLIIDGDGAPSIKKIEEISKIYNIETIIFCDYAHIINSEYSKVIQVDCGYQNVDMNLINHVKENDIIITNDYGLASLGLSKKCFVIDFKGKIYNDENIDILLLNRHNAYRSNKFNTIKKRTSKDDVKLISSLLFIIKSVIE